MNRRTSKNLKRLTPLLILVLIPVFIVGSATSKLNASLMDQMPSNFQPVQVGSISFDVYDFATYPRNIIGSVTLDPNGESRFFTDNTHTYPNIDVFYTTNPYNSDSRGNYNPDNSSWITTSLTIEDRMYVLHEGYISFGFGARTLSNPPAWRTDTTQALDLLDGFTISHAGTTWTLDAYDGTLDKYKIPRGLLLYTVDTEPGLFRGWVTGSSAGGARITQSIEKIDFNAAIHGTPVSAGYMNMAGAKNRLATQYGNSPVIVRPVINLDARSNFLRYNFNETSTLPNGTRITTTLETTSNLVGFESAWENVPLRQSTLITKVGDDQFDRTNFEATDPETFKDNSGSVQNDNVDPPVTVSTYTGGVKYLRDTSPVGGELLGQKMDIANAYTSLYAVRPSINLNDVAAGHLSLPSTLTTYTDFTLQPSTRIKSALTQVYGGVHQYDGVIPDMYDEFNSLSANIEYPYAISITNVACYCVITAKVALITSNEIRVSCEGQPINTDDLRDYDLGSMINNPTVDDVVVTSTNTQINWWKVLENLFTGFTGWLMWIAIGAAAVAVIYVVFMFKGKKH